MAVATVLYRPLLFEVHNVTAGLAAVEASLLLVITAVRFRWILAAVRTLRDQPYVAFCGAFVAGGIIALSSIANFGILARERVLILPGVPRLPGHPSEAPASRTTPPGARTGPWARRPLSGERRPVPKRAPPEARLGGWMRPD